MTSDQPEGEPPDLLEFGLAIVAARPRLERRLRALTEDSDRARQIAERTLNEGWRLRDKAPPVSMVEPWLVDILRRQVLD